MVSVSIVNVVRKMKERSSELSIVISRDDLDELEQCHFEKYLQKVKKPEGRNDVTLIDDVRDMANFMSRRMELSEPTLIFATMGSQLLEIADGFLSLTGEIRSHLREHALKINIQGPINDAICSSYRNLFAKGLVGAALLLTILEGGEG